MTQTEINSLLGQINKAFQDQTDKLEQVQVRLQALESKFNEQEKGSKVGTRGRKRIQQAEENTEPRNEEVCGSSQEGG
jgi:septal ring factor EnvC (AmiA/AmiB activator)